MSTSRKRQKLYRRRMIDAGLVQVTGWVPADEAAAVKLLMRALAENTNLTPGPARCKATMKLVTWPEVRYAPHPSDEERN
jgi:hypothetical protein